MREIDLKSYQIRTDLVLDQISNIKDIPGITEEVYEENKVSVSNLEINDEAAKKLNKKKGFYTTIYFDDITDYTNFNNVKKIFISELNKILEKEKVKQDNNILIIGLGNEKSTPDALGPKTLDDIIVTKHIYDIVGSLENGYKITSKISPGVMGTTGIETSDILSSILKKVNPDYLIVIDALASDSVSRVGKTIQITNTGINPGSGIGNKRKEISKDIFNIPVIAIGIPMVVDAVTIVYDTINFMMQHFKFNIKNKDSLKNKIIPSSMQNYLKEQENLSLNEKEKTYFLGAFGNLSDFEKKALIFDVLTPVGYNLMVTPKEVDFLIDKLSKLLSLGINEVLHDKKEF